MYHLLGGNQLAGAGPSQAARSYYEDELEAFPASIDEGDVPRLLKQDMHACCRFIIKIQTSDADLPEEDVIERIESCIIVFLEEVFLRGIVPDISLVIHSHDIIFSPLLADGHP